MHFFEIRMNGPNFVQSFENLILNSSIDFSLKPYRLIVLKTLVIIPENVSFSKNLGTLAPGPWLNLPS